MYEDSHWTLVIVDQRKRVIRYHDSLSRGDGMALCIAVRQYLDKEYRNKKDKSMSLQYRIEANVATEQQSNGYDCGIHVLKVVRALVDCECAMKSTGDVRKAIIDGITKGRI